MNNTEKLYNYKFGSIYDLYLAKVQRKERTEEELDDILSWLSGYDISALKGENVRDLSLKEFFEQAPGLSPQRMLVSGSICGVKIVEIEDPMTKEIRIMDKLVDELAKGKKIEKIKRG